MSERVISHPGSDSDLIARLGKALRVLRHRAELSMAAAALKAGLGSGMAWSKYELGRAPSILQPSTQASLTSALGLTVEDLMREAGLKSPPVDAGLAPSPAAASHAAALAPVFASEALVNRLADGTALITFLSPGVTRAGEHPLDTPSLSVALPAEVARGLGLMLNPPPAEAGQ